VPQGIAAQVGPHAVTRASLKALVARALRAIPASERPQPPEFDACVRHLKEEPATPEDSEAGRAQLKHECLERYRGVQQQTLERLIAGVWVLEGARELGVSSTGAEATAGLTRAASVPGDATIGTALDLAAKRDVIAMRMALAQRARIPDRTEIADYYRRHRARYVSVQEHRDLNIVGTHTEARATQIRLELASGKSFAQVVKESGVRQADYSSEGLALRLSPNVYGEPRLNRAMFAARPGVLTGPVATIFGYYIFEVKKIYPARYKSLSAVAASIRSQLTKQRRTRAFASFLARWRAKWTAETSCRQGFVVPGCREFDGSGAEPPNELYALQ